MKRFFRFPVHSMRFDRRAVNVVAHLQMRSLVATIAVLAAVLATLRACGFHLGRATLGLLLIAGASLVTASVIELIRQR